MAIFTSKKHQQGSLMTILSTKQNVNKLHRPVFHNVQSTLKTYLSMWTNTKRQQQMQEIVGKNKSLTISPEVRQANQFLTLSFSALLALIVGNIGAPVFSLLGIVLVTYLHWDPIKISILDLTRYKKINPLIIYIPLLMGTFIGGLYLEAAVGMFTYALTNKLLAITRNHSHKELVNIMGTQPRAVWALVNGVEVNIPFEDIHTGDVVVIGAGQTIPIDGAIIQGVASIDQQCLTGEAQPIEKEVGDSVMAATTVLSGKIFIEVEKTGTETVAAQIGEVLNNSAEFESSALSRSDKIMGAATLPTLGLSSIGTFLAGVQGGMGILLASFGYNLRILSPLSMLNFLHIASHNGILIKDGRSFEQLGQIDTVVFDKTGTLTLEQPHVAQVHILGDLSADDVLRYAAAAEERQTHPIAKAILAAAHERALDMPTIDTASYELGYGLKVAIDNHMVHVGSDRFMTLEQIELSPTAYELQHACHAQGYSLVMVAVNYTLVGAIELHPTIRPEAKQVIRELKNANLDLYIISGDQEEPTRKLAHELGIENYFANILPEHKANHVTQLQESGRSVCFVGDGINDAIALRAADVSISLSGATAAATDTAQIVLMNADLAQFPMLLQMAHYFKRNMDMNIALSIIPGVVMIGGVFILKMSLLSAIGLMNFGLAVGVVNALSPQWRFRPQMDLLGYAK